MRTTKEEKVHGYYKCTCCGYRMSRVTWESAIDSFECPGCSKTHIWSFRLIPGADDEMYCVKCDRSMSFDCKPMDHCPFCGTFWRTGR